MGSTNTCKGGEGALWLLPLPSSPCGACRAGTGRAASGTRGSEGQAQPTVCPCTGGQYPTGCQCPTGGQCPTDCQCPTGGQCPTDCQCPTHCQCLTDCQCPTDYQCPTLPGSQPQLRGTHWLWWGRAGAPTEPNTSTSVYKEQEGDE